jgi:hypothetical protein
VNQIFRDFLFHPARDLRKRRCSRETFIWAQQVYDIGCPVNNNTSFIALVRTGSNSVITISSA